MPFRRSRLSLILVDSLLAVLVIGVVGVSAQGSIEPVSVDFQRDVRPILADYCFQCHGPDEATRRAGLRLDTQDGALGTRARGPAVVPGNLEASQLYQRITHGEQGLSLINISEPTRRYAIAYAVF